MEFNNKPIKLFASSGWNDKYGEELHTWVVAAMKVLWKYPVDMMVFEMIDEKYLQIRLAGYDFNTGELDEETTALKVEYGPVETFWFKVDDYGDYYVGTFLFPSEY